MTEDKEKNLKFIDVSGLGNSGKSAVVDCLRGFKTFSIDHYSFEFDLFRLPGGLVDLYQNTSERWTPIRSHFAYFEFKNLVQQLSGSAKRKSLWAFFFSAGMGYELIFKNQFKKLSFEFLDALVINKYSSFWPYNLIYDSAFTRAYKKICIKLKIQSGLYSEVLLIHSKDFKQKSTDYVNQLFKIKTEAHCKTVVLNNLFEPFQPELGLDILKNSKLIIVTRDPRDIYASGQSAGSFNHSDAQLQAFDNNGYNKSFLATNDLKTFVDRQKLYFDQMTRKNDPRIYIVRFEDFILNHVIERKKLFEFLEVDEKDYVTPADFKPENSAKNIGLYQRYSKQDEIKYIAEQLKDYLYEK